MKPRLLGMLSCPACDGENLSLDSEKGSKTLGEEEIETGILRCDECGTTYPIIRGIPRMIPEAERYFDLPEPSGKPPGKSRRTKADEELADAMKLTVTQYSAYQGEVYAPMAERLQNARILEARTGLSKEDFEGRKCLDAGCGVGRMTRVSAESGAELVVGFDAGFAVDEAKRMTPESITNIEWVQGDILRAPFRKGVFDRVMSIGVLHHTAKPDAGFRRLSRSVNGSGSFSVYLYTHGYLTWDRTRSVKRALGRLRFALFTEPFRRLIVRLPDSWRKVFCRMLWIRRRMIENVRRWWLIGPFLAKMIEFLTPPDIYKPLEDAESNIARNFDMYSTPYNYSHDFTEVIDWYEREKRFRSVEVTPYRLSLTGFAGEERKGDDPMVVSYRARKGIEKIEAAGVEADTANS